MEHDSIVMGLQLGLPGDLWSALRSSPCVMRQREIATTYAKHFWCHTSHAQPKSHELPNHDYASFCNQMDAFLDKQDERQHPHPDYIR